jgi:threonine aldolase
MTSTGSVSNRQGNKLIDLRSDTVTKPTSAMRKIMANAEVGDDVFGDDPSINALEIRMAQMTGKQAALLLPSGTQSNLVALLSHCQRGEEYIVGQDYHTYLYEAGGAAVLGSIVPQPIAVEEDGSLNLGKVATVIKPDDSHFAITKLLVVENTHSGKVLSLEYMKNARDFVKTNGLSLHLDGARIFNAAIKLGVPISSITQYVDSVSICCSKGLGAPVGSLLCGSFGFIQGARRWRKMLGGGMRQGGVLAAAIDHALDNHVTRLQIDHDNAQFLAQQLEQIKGINVEHPQTNMLYLKLPSKEIAEQLSKQLKSEGILISGEQRIRLVTHLDVNREDMLSVSTNIKQILATLLKRQS